MGIRIAVDENGARSYYREYVDPESGVIRYMQVDSALAKAVAPQSALKQQSLPELPAQNRASLDRAKEAANMTFLQRAPIAMGEEAANLYLKGPSQLYDALAPSIVGLKYPQTGKKMEDIALKNEMLRMKEDPKLDELMSEFNITAGPGDVVARSVPYVLNSVLAGPITKKAVSSAVDAATEVGKQVGNEAKSLLGRGSRALAAKPGITGKVGTKIMDEYTLPIEEWAAASKAKVPWSNPFNKGTLSDVLSSGLLGGVEGGLHYKNSAISGAEAGIAGGIPGVMLAPKLTRRTRPENPNYNAAVDTANRVGYRVSPGEYLGDITEQQAEQGMRNSKAYGFLYSKFDEANTKALNRHAYEALGIPKGTTDYLTPDALSEHMANLSREYQKIESGTTIRLNKSDVSGLKQHAAKLANDQTEEGIKATKAVESYMSRIEKLRKSQNKNGGNFAGTLSGDTYQGLRSELKDKVTTAYAKGDSEYAKALKPILDTLDNSVERGIVLKGGTPEEGKALLSQWKDLNERFAMSKVFQVSGSDAFLNADPYKLANFFKNKKEVERYLKADGGRIKNFQDIARVAEVDRRQAGSTLSGQHMTEEKLFGDTKKDSELGVMLKPDINKPSVVREMLFRTRMSGWPKTTGYLGMSGKDFGKPMVYTRSMAGASQAAPFIINKLGEAKDWTEDKYNSAQQGLDTIWKAIQNMSNIQNR